MNKIRLDTHSKVAPNCARVGLASQGDAADSPEGVHAVQSLDADGHHRRQPHEAGYLGEEWLVRKVRIVIRENFVIQLHHLDANQLEALILEARNYRS